MMFVAFPKTDTTLQYLLDLEQTGPTGDLIVSLMSELELVLSTCVTFITNLSDIVIFFFQNIR